jgi:hypothetical protein
VGSLGGKWRIVGWEGRGVVCGKLALSKWFCDTSTEAAIGAACCGSFVGKAFSLFVVSYR